MSSLSEATVTLLSAISQRTGFDVERLKSSVQHCFEKRCYGPAVKAYDSTNSEEVRDSIRKTLTLDMRNQLLRPGDSDYDQDANKLINGNILMQPKTFLVDLLRSHRGTSVPSVVDRFKEQGQDLLNTDPSDPSYASVIEDLVAEKAAVLSLGSEPISEAGRRDRMEHHLGRVRDRLRTMYGQKCSNPWTAAEDKELEETVAPYYFDAWRAQWEGFRSDPSFPPTSDQYNGIKIAQNPQYAVHQREVDRVCNSSGDGMWAWEVMPETGGDDSATEGEDDPDLFP